MRTLTNFGELKPGDRFYQGPRSKIAYRKLPNCETSDSDHGHSYPATIYKWVKEDFSKFYTRHSWSGGPDDVWVEK